MKTSEKSKPLNLVRVLPIKNCIVTLGFYLLVKCTCMDIPNPDLHKSGIVLRFLNLHRCSLKST